MYHVFSEVSPLWELNAFTTGNHFWGTNLLEVSMRRDFGALNGVRLPPETDLEIIKTATGDKKKVHGLGLRRESGNYKFVVFPTNFGIRSPVNQKSFTQKNGIP